ncbi:hypothetical protein [Actinoplanes aureus]|uniref:Uncharacterized protein n=1 Tax=Actinoplanes aureus TaxID=2792083 RepID=A0A931CMR6_9ACTN|nr:hypothetical protein [Actinoplanes aureus]MBG0569193.1 hypothetical protein [Actinoplanes aureus]
MDEEMPDQGSSQDWNLGAWLPGLYYPGVVGADTYRTAVERVTALASRLAPVVDLPSSERLADILTDAGWVTERPGRFTADGLTASVFADWGTTAIHVDLHDFGCPEEVDYSDYDIDESYNAARDQLYLDAEAAMRTVAGLLGLPPADPLAIDLRADYGERILLGSGHWAVAVAVVHEGPDLPIVLEVSLAYGADLPGRLAQLAGPPHGYHPVDWEAISAHIEVDMPDDYRWLMENYGPGTFDDYLTLIAPEELSKPQFGPLTVTGSWHQTLPLTTTPDEVVVSAILFPRWNGLKVTAPGMPDRDVSGGLLQFPVVLLSGAERLPQFPSRFPTRAPRFKAAGPV